MGCIIYIRKQTVTTWNMTTKASRPSKPETQWSCKLKYKYLQGR